jgi:hypothetical protein
VSVIRPRRRPLCKIEEVFFIFLVQIEQTKAKNSPEVVNNNLFVGNTAQLDQIIKQMSKKQNND